MSVSLVKRPTAQGTLWVCVDCMMTEATGEAIERDAASTEPEPWARESATDVTSGLDSTEHECDYAAGEWQECECETQTFSRSQCDGCGTWLGGSRHAYTWWA